MPYNKVLLQHEGNEFTAFLYTRKASKIFFSQSLKEYNQSFNDGDPPHYKMYLYGNWQGDIQIAMPQPNIFSNISGLLGEWFADFTRSNSVA